MKAIVMRTNELEPFTVEVIRHGLTAAAEEMSLVVMRSARSPLFAKQAIYRPRSRTLKVN